MPYYTIAQLRELGAVPGSVSDPYLTASRAAWISFIERTTRQWFESKAGTYLLDGSGNDVLFLPVPIIDITSLFINDDFVTALASTEYLVYNSRDVPDDRRNPKIRMKPSSAFFPNTTLLATSIFARGRRNQKIIGNFGFLEPDDTTPPLINRALLKLVMRDVKNPPTYASPVGAGEAGSSGTIVSEKTDGHSVTYATPQVTGLKAGTRAMTGDSEVDGILSQYRAPTIVAASSAPIFQARM